MLREKFKEKIKSQQNEKYKRLTNFKIKTEEKIKSFDYKDYNSTLAFLQSKDNHNIKKLQRGT